MLYGHASRGWHGTRHTPAGLRRPDACLVHWQNRGGRWLAALNRSPRQVAGGISEGTGQLPMTVVTAQRHSP
jgi:hypothetical protein